MANKLPTIKEIAQRLNVSVSTVSRALSDNPRIGLGTRLKVQQLAKELNYEPNSKAIFFKQSKSFVIGLVVPYIREDFFGEAISGIEEITMAFDYTILFGQSYDDMEHEIRVVNAMKKQRVDGLLISLSKTTNRYGHLQALAQLNIPVVYFDRVPPFEQAHKVYCNLYSGTVNMVAWLFKQGYRRIAFINGPSTLPASKERLKGFIEGVSRQKQKVDMLLVEETDLSMEGTYRAIENLLKLKLRPTAIITFNEYVHMDAVQHAHALGVKVNEEIAFASYANLAITNYTAFPPVISVEQYPRRQGEEAMNMMMSLLNEKELENGQYLSKQLPALLTVHK